MGAGKDNNNYKHGRYVANFCRDCHKKIRAVSERCHRCRALANPSFKGKHHSLVAKKIIGLKSKAKFTPDFLERVYHSKSRGNKKRDINGYTLIKDYNHPNRNMHNDVLEHIKIMSELVARPLIKGEVVHHINFQRDDNRQENLYLYANRSAHLKGHGSIHKLIASLLERHIIMFKNGEYILNE
jgi:hypothetical protein